MIEVLLRICNPNICWIPNLKLSDASTAKTLGFLWNTTIEAFFFNPAPKPDFSVITKRSVLSY